MTTITLQTPKSINLQVVSGTVQKTVNKVDILSLVDNSSDKVTSNYRMHFQGGGSRVVQKVLWEGTDYINIGDWTQAQAESRIIELI